jgi:aldehyde:ferredoxin oxidoreductase
VRGFHRGYVASLTGGGEAMEGSAAMVGIVDPGDILYLTDLYDRLGIDGSTAGCAISMAFEAYEKGYISKEDTDGLELRWGDAEVIEKIVRKYCNREGFGDILAMGPKLAADRIGHDAPSFAVHIKGTGMNLHDWRPKWGVLLGQIVGSGAGWPSGAADCWRSEPDAGYPEKTNGMTHRGKAEEVARCAIIKCLDDSIGVCWFASWGYPGIMELSANAISAVTGWDITTRDLWEVGERILALQQAFNIKQGWTPKDDYEVPARVTEAPPDGPAKGISIKPYLRGMINEYYRYLGWDEKTGKPWRRTLARLNLDPIIRDLWN